MLTVGRVALGDCVGGLVEKAVSWSFRRALGRKWSVPMTAITIPLSDGQLTKLQEMARRLRVPPETLLVATLEDLLSRPDEEFQRTMEYVLRKNEELYRRLAVGG